MRIYFVGMFVISLVGLIISLDLYIYFLGKTGNQGRLSIVQMVEYCVLLYYIFFVLIKHICNEIFESWHTNTIYQVRKINLPFA